MKKELIKIIKTGYKKYLEHVNNKEQDKKSYYRIREYEWVDQIYKTSDFFDFKEYELENICENIIYNEDSESKESVKIIKFKKGIDEVFIRFTSEYDSYEGDYWKLSFEIVEPKEVKITNYVCKETINL